jgi:hypothetical protein
MSSDDMILKIFSAGSLANSVSGNETTNVHEWTRPKTGNPLTNADKRY